VDEQLREKWQLYFNNNVRATPFARPEWLWPHGNQGNISPFVLDLGCGYAPLERITRNTTRTIRLSGADYEDIVAQPGKELEAVVSLLKQLQERSGEWDICDFRTLLPESVIMSVFTDADGKLTKNPELTSLLRRLTCSVMPHHVYYRVEIPVRWEQYEDHLGKKLAYQMRSAEGRRQRHFGSSLLRRATPETVEEDLQALFDLHSSRWQAKGHSGHFSSEAARAGFRLRALGLLELGQLRLYTLWLDGKPASALFTLADDRRIYYYASGFDTSFGKHHPTKVLISEAIKDGIKEGPKEFDFMKGEEEYKLTWANSQRTTSRLVIARNTPQGLGALAVLKLQSRYKERKQAKER
jgi:hypothetical protein